MKSDDPYIPVQIPASRFATSNRPFYIYSTAVVMLLWSGIYVYLQSQGNVSSDLESDTVSSPARIALRLYEFSAVHVVVFFALSIVFVNGSLWAVLKMIKR